MTRTVIDNYSPAGDWLLIEPLPRDTTEGGIALPDGSDPEPARGRVIKCGPGKYNEFLGDRQPMNSAPGDIVVLTFERALQLKISGKEYLLVPDRNIFCLFKAS